ncbi:MAG: SMI1/KNR4 family protein [Clostridia bacterium]|nr:SMI1/KNR4 family protein [Clostridia bacterium]
MLDDIINKIEGRPDLINLNEGGNSDAESFFKNNLKCEYVPKQIVEFYEKYDGATFTINDLYSLDELSDLFDSLNDEAYAFDIDMEKDRFVPIADDGQGGYYAFISNREDDKIYWIDHENVGNSWYTNRDLADFLDEMLGAAIYCEENE